MVTACYTLTCSSIKKGMDRVSRQIKDSIVLRNFQSADVDISYFEELSLYSGQVVDTIDKVKLEKAVIGLGKFGISSFLASKYRSCKVQDGDCIISIDGGRVTKVGSNFLRMLKALLIEQVNPNEQYCSIVAYIFMSMVMQAVKKVPALTFDPPDNITNMQLIIFNGLSGYVLKELEGKIIAVGQEVK